MVSGPYVSYAALSMPRPENWKLRSQMISTQTLFTRVATKKTGMRAYKQTRKRLPGANGRSLDAHRSMPNGSRKPVWPLPSRRLCKSVWLLGIREYIPACPCQCIRHGIALQRLRRLQDRPTPSSGSELLAPTPSSPNHPPSDNHGGSRIESTSPSAPPKSPQGPPK